jgi:hypothetical protein
VRADPYVQMFIWLVFRDDPGDPLKSGLVAADGTRKPALFSFGLAARPVDAHNAIISVRPGVAPVVRVAGLEIAYRSGAGAAIGVNERVFEHGRLVAVSQPRVPMGIDGYFGVPVNYRPTAGHVYTLQIDASDIHGNRILRTLTLVTRSR